MTQRHLHRGPISELHNDDLVKTARNLQVLGQAALAFISAGLPAHRWLANGSASVRPRGRFDQTWRCNQRGAPVSTSW